jgi:uncharacterized protein with NRDE domain
LGPGLYGLSNAALDSPWPKLETLKLRLRRALGAQDGLQALVADGLDALADRTPAPEHQLPHTGLPRERERQLSSAFIHIAGDGVQTAYGTRCSTVVVVERCGRQRCVHIMERSFDVTGEVAGEVCITHTLPAAQ